MSAQSDYFEADNRYHKSWEHREAINEALLLDPENERLLSDLRIADDNFSAATRARTSARQAYVAIGAVI
jgi:hypothetical protein